MGIEITLPEQEINKEEREQQIRKVFGEDFENKGGLLSKLLVFIKIHEPASITELTNKIQEYYGQEIDRVTIFRCMDRLAKLGVVHRAISGEILAMSEEEK